MDEILKEYRAIDGKVFEGVGLRKMALVREFQIRARNKLLLVARECGVEILAKCFESETFNIALDILDPETPLGDGCGTRIERPLAAYNSAVAVLNSLLG